ncbi:hypothetical protein [Leptolyngbya sp. NIES-2104]|uniref:hypothetical protein n=1 Tax=Leptolyngbya sp. NIES-2104 TaxID=1552121 RepID=UPI0006EC85A6|nr:hypothetical protein [Leptolyngbya sp. NIES-2104]GAQ00186.1 hypothetical protein NIES2104_67510 [Leptolyngbya sp. NIES-2104]
MRITIKSHLIHYIEEVSSQLGIDDATEVVSIILLDHKRGICRCSRSQTHQSETPTALAKDPNELLADGLEDLLNSASY